MSTHSSTFSNYKFSGDNGVIDLCEHRDELLGRVQDDWNRERVITAIMSTLKEQHGLDGFWEYGHAIEITDDEITFTKSDGAGGTTGRTKVVDLTNPAASALQAQAQRVVFIADYHIGGHKHGCETDASGTRHDFYAGRDKVKHHYTHRDPSASRGGGSLRHTHHYDRAPDRSSSSHSSHSHRDHDHSPHGSGSRSSSAPYVPPGPDVSRHAPTYRSSTADFSGTVSLASPDSIQSSLFGPGTTTPHTPSVASPPPVAPSLVFIPLAPATIPSATTPAPTGAPPLVPSIATPPAPDVPDFTHRDHGRSMSSIDLGHNSHTHHYYSFSSGKGGAPDGSPAAGSPGSSTPPVTSTPSPDKGAPAPLSHGTWRSHVPVPVSSRFSGLFDDDDDASNPRPDPMLDPAGRTFGKITHPDSPKAAPAPSPTTPRTVDSDSDTDDDDNALLKKAMHAIARTGKSSLNPVSISFDGDDDADANTDGRAFAKITPGKPGAVGAGTPDPIPATPRTVDSDTDTDESDGEGDGGDGTGTGVPAPAPDTGKGRSVGAPDGDSDDSDGEDGEGDEYGAAVRNGLMQDRAFEGRGTQLGNHGGKRKGRWIDPDEGYTHASKLLQGRPEAALAKTEQRRKKEASRATAPAPSGIGSPPSPVEPPTARHVGAGAPKTEPPGVPSAAERKKAEALAKREQAKAAREQEIERARIEKETRAIIEQRSAAARNFVPV